MNTGIIRYVFVVTWCFVWMFSVILGMLWHYFCSASCRTTFFLHRNALTIVDESHPPSSELSSAFQRFLGRLMSIAFLTKLNRQKLQLRFRRSPTPIYPHDSTCILLNFIMPWWITMQNRQIGWRQMKTGDIAEGKDLLSLLSSSHLSCSGVSLMATALRIWGLGIASISYQGQTDRHVSFEPTWLRLKIEGRARERLGTWTCAWGYA